MSDFKVTSNHVEQTHALGEILGKCAFPNNIISLIGDLGAGKTQLTQGIAKGLGIQDQITSPTFSLINTYPNDKLDLHHADLYRIEDPMELIDIDLVGILESGGLSVIEWGNLFASELGDDVLEIRISKGDDAVREFIFRATGDASKSFLMRVQEELEELF